MNQPAIENFSDAQLERDISSKKRELEREPSPIRRQVLLREFEALIGQRSQIQISKMERERNLT